MLGCSPCGIGGPPIQANIEETGLGTYIFIGRFKLVDPFVASCFGGSVCAIGGLLPYQLSVCSDFDFQLSNLLIAPASCLPQSTQTASIAKTKPRAVPQPQQRLSDPEFTSLIPCCLPISPSSHNRTPHGCSEAGFRSLVPVYPFDGRDKCKIIFQRSLT